MRTRRLSTRPERAADRILRRTLADAGWIFSAQTSIQSVLDKQDDRLSPEEFSLYTRGSFDFVVCWEEDHEPDFAIEFDGYGHVNPRQVARDIIKNRLCARAGLPLLRIGGEELQERERISVLEWLVERFKVWELETPERAEEFLAELESSPGGEPVARAMREDPDQAQRLFAVFAATFSAEFPFPANAEIARRLYRRFRISLSKPMDDYEPNDKAPYALDVAWPGRHRFESTPVGTSVVCERDAKLRARGHPEVDLLATQGHARFVSEHRVGPGPDDLVAQELPWLEPDWIVMDLALYEALTRVEQWAGSNLRDYSLRAH